MLEYDGRLTALFGTAFIWNSGVGFKQKYTKECFSSQQLPAENHNRSWQTLSAGLPIKFLAEKAECPAGNGKVWMC